MQSLDPVDVSVEALKARYGKQDLFFDVKGTLQFSTAPVCLDIYVK